MKILITGANGYIGKHVVDELLNKGIDVTAVDIDIQNINKKAKIIRCDIFNNFEDLVNGIKEIDTCLHLAWKDGFIHNSESHINMLPLHYKFLNNLVDIGIKNICIMGTMHEIGYYEGEINSDTPCNPVSLYGIAKNTLRQLAFKIGEENDVNIKWLRAFYITGDDLNNHSIFSKIIKANEKGEKLFPFNSGECKYDFIDIKELAKQISSCCIVKNNSSDIVNCCSGKPVKLKDKVEEFIKINKLEIKLNYGAFPSRKYDSPAIWGNIDKLKEYYPS